MRKILLFLICLFVLLTNCKKSDSEMDSTYNPVQLSDVPEDGLVLSSKVGASATFKVVSSQSWTASVKSGTESDVGWISVNPMQGTSGTTEVTVQITEENPLNDERTANIVIGQNTLTVTQKGKDALILSKSKWEVPADGKIIDIEVEYNVDYNIFIPIYYNSWIRQINNSKSLQKNTISFEIDAITDEDLWSSRNGEIYIIGKGEYTDLTDTIYVYQSQKDRIVASAENEPITFEGGILKVVIRSNIDYTYEIIDKPNWIRTTETPVYKSLKVDEVFFEIDLYDELTSENRTAKIAFTNNYNASDTVYVTQSYMDAIVKTRDSYNIDYNSFTFEVVMQTNTDDYKYRFEYEEGSDEWLKKKETVAVKSLRNESFVFTANQNFGPKRTGKIIFTANNSGMEQEVVIEQGPGPQLVSSFGPRLMWATRCFTQGVFNAQAPTLSNSALISWRYMPGDDANLGFNIYRRSNSTNGQYIKLNSEPIVNSTNFLDDQSNFNETNYYRLENASTGGILDELEFTASMAAQPYISIPLIPADAPDADYPYKIMDVAVGDLDGDGEYELIVKRECDPWMQDVYHQGYSPGETLIEAYKVDGTFMWRVGLGPNISQGKPTSPFVVADFDGDGRCEVLIRSSELTTFGDGFQIGDVNGDGKTFYQEAADGRLLSGPEFFSVIDGVTGAEFAREDYIERGPSEEWAATWGDDWGNRMNRYMMGCGYFDGTDKKPSILITRGYYAKTVLEAWDFDRATGLTKRWNFTALPNGQNSAYAGQGNHQMALGDIDDDGKDEIVYGAMSVDHDGKGMYSSGWGHGDALHLGKFDPKRSGLQIWSCFEDGYKGATFRDARTGQEIHGFDDSSDVGRALVADIDPDNPGCEMWTSEGRVFDVNGNVLYTIDDIGGSRLTAVFYSTMAIWWTGSLNRQFLAQTMIDEYIPGEGISRVNTLWYFDVKYTNDTKNTPAFYGDIFGDWREEIIFPTSDDNEIRIFSTPYVTEYRFPYLMSDHIYHLSTIHQNVGYNPPTHLGYYLGSDLLK